MPLPELPLNIDPSPPKQKTGKRAGEVAQTHRGKDRSNDKSEQLTYPDSALRYAEGED